MSSCRAYAYLGPAVVVMVLGVGWPAIVQAQTLPGFCLFARGTAIRASRAGAAARADLDRIEATIGRSNAQERQRLIDEGVALNKRRDQLTPEAFQASQNGLGARARKLDETTRSFSGQLAKAREATQSRIDDALDPILESVRARRGCLVVMERNNAYIYANSLDVTQEVVAGLDRALPSISVGISPP